jgi:hypothetical protein
MQTSSRLTLIAIFATWSVASVLSFSGNLRTDATVLDCGPGCTLNAASTDSDFAQWAAAVYSFSVPTPSLMQAVTVSYADGGFEPYLSLFDGSGNFLASTFFGTTCPPDALINPTSGACFDVLLDGGALGAGSYQIAISAFENLSLAENFGAGTLAGGFTGLGNLAAGEDLHYAFNVTLASTSSVPEPSYTWLLTAAAILGWLYRLHKRNFKGDLQ